MKTFNYGEKHHMALKNFLRRRREQLFQASHVVLLEQLSKLLLRKEMSFTS